MPWLASMPWPWLTFDVVQLSCPLSRKTPQSIMFPPPCLTVGMVFLGSSSIPPPPNTASWVDAKVLNFGLIWPQHFHPVLLWIIGTLQTGCTCAFLSRGPCGSYRISVLHGVVCYQLFSWWLWSQLPWDHWQDPPVQFWADSSPFSWSLKLHEVRSCKEPQSEGDWQLFCVSSICE